MLRLVALITVPLGMLMSGAAEAVVSTVYGSQWGPAVPAVHLFGAWAAIRATQSMLGWLLNSIGRASDGARVSAVQLVILVPGVIVGALLAGITGVAVVMVVDILVATVLLGAILHRRGEVTVGEQFRSVTPALVLAAPVWASACVASHVATNAGAPAPGPLVAAVIAAGLVHVAGLRLVFPKAFADVMHGLRAMTGGRPSAAAI